MPIFPDVPNVPGVPSLARDPAAVVIPFVLLTADAFGLIGFLGAFPRWGLFRNGVPVVVADNVLSFDFKKDWTVSNYPLEKGAFESYDKVELPFDVRLQFSSGGSEFERQALIDSIAAIAGTLDLFDAATPEEVYPSVNVMHYDYRRTSSKGVGLVIVDVWCVQVRSTATAAFTSSAQSLTSTKSPSGSDATDGGTVQPKAPTTIPETH